MKIFDTKYFVNNILLEDNSVSINPIIEMENVLTKSFIGEKKIDVEIENIGNFADESNQQLIFELLQNADDANNDRHEKQGVFALFTGEVDGENYLMAINNGKPFDTYRKNDDNPDIGYLHKFLGGIGKANTKENNNTTGKFGKGSKLIYNLFIDDTDTANKVSVKRRKAIVEQLEGPIICSWNTSGFLEKLRLFEIDDNIILTQQHEAPIITKIINAYYPTFPGEKHLNNEGNLVDVFSINELNVLVKFIKGLDVNLFNTFYSRGSLLFIKLGKGQTKFTQDEFKQEYMRAISNYLSFSKNLGHIYFDNTKISRTELLSTGKLSKEGHEFEILFPKRVEDLQRTDFVNFYNQLPIVKEAHGLRFIINSDEFDILDTRQNINFGDSSAVARLDDVADLIFDFIYDERNDFKERLFLYMAVINSDISYSTKSEIKDFYTNLIEKVSSIAPVEDSFVESNKVILIDSPINQILLDIKLDSIYWLNESVNGFSDDIHKKAKISKFNLLQVLIVASIQGFYLKNWIKGLDSSDYHLLIGELSAYSAANSLNSIPFIKASDGEVYSIEEFATNSDFFIINTNSSVRKMLIQYGAVLNEFLFDADLDRFVSNQEILIDFLNLNRDSILADQKASLVSFLQSIKSNQFGVNFIGSKLSIFHNRLGEYCSLSNLSNNVSIPYPKSIFDFALIQSDEYNIVLDSYFFPQDQLWIRFIKFLQEKQISLNFDKNELLSFKALADHLSQSILHHFNIFENNSGYQIIVNDSNTTQYISEDNKLNKFLEDKSDYNIIPESLWDIFQKDDLKSDLHIIKDVIEKYGSVPELIDVVMKSSIDIKTLYIEGIERFELYSNNVDMYSKSSYEYKVSKLVIDEQVISIDDFRQIMLIDGKNLDEYGYEERLRIDLDGDKIAFNLSELLEEYKGVTDAIAKLKSSALSNKIFNLELMESEQVLKSLKDIDEYTPKQAAFIIIAAMAELDTPDIDLIEDSNENYWYRLLDELFLRLIDAKNKVFSEVYCFDNIDFKEKIITGDINYLIEEEQLPDWILNWIGDSKDKQKFLKQNGLEKHTSIIDFRKNYLKDSKVNHKMDELFMNNSLLWITDQDTELTNIAILNIKYLIKSFSENFESLSDYVITFQLDDNGKLGSILEELSDSVCYINKYSEFKGQLLELVESNEFEYQIINNTLPSVDCAIFEKCNIEELIIKPELDEDKILNAVEWNKEYYQQWRRTDNGKQYEIYFLNNEVPLNYIALVGDDDYELEWVSGGNLSNIKHENLNKIYISNNFIESENKHTLVILEENKNNIDIEDSHLLSLNKFYIDFNEQRNNIIEKANITEEELEIIYNNREHFEKFLNGEFEVGGTDGNGNVTLDRDLSKEEQDALNDLLKKYSLEEIEELIRKSEALSEDDANVNSLTGLIGEYAFFAYLNEKLRKVEYVADSQSAYDFVVDGNILVDTKTTVRSVRGNSDSVPFYIKPSQYQYMLGNKAENYYIVRLSIDDLGLQSIRSKYIDLKDKESKDMPKSRKKALMNDIQEFYKLHKNQQRLNKSKMAFKLGRDSIFD